MFMELCVCLCVCEVLFTTKTIHHEKKPCSCDQVRSPQMVGIIGKNRSQDTCHVMEIESRKNLDE